MMAADYKKEMIYDAMALRLVIALEWFVKNGLQSYGSKFREREPYSMHQNVADFCREFNPGTQIMMGVCEATNRILHTRNEFVHAKHGFLPMLDYDGFRRFRESCIELDRLFWQIPNGPGMSPMSSIMFHSLAYNMGNAGDLIKHGVLVHFIRWWFEQNRTARPFCFADPFGGCPWEIMENDEIERRLRDLPDRVVAEDLLRGDGRYYNSGHIVDFVARQCDGAAMVRTSDSNNIARSDLAASAYSMRAKDMLLFEDDPKFAYLAAESDNGLAILQPKFAKEANGMDLILIDPYGTFLRNEFISKDADARAKTFDNAINAVSRNDKLCVMFFLLDMWGRDNDNTDTVAEIHHRYVDDYRPRLSECAISLRCPKIADKYDIKGESNYEMEVLLISQMFAKGGGEELCNRLAEFKDAAQKVLPLDGKEIELWPHK